ncbi:MAG: hypothetical protein H7A46_02855 [Verrucomicrobiales bacterium]|nr:hypothetical protein [Verrucomicrobiales bacterium]
MEFDDAQMHRIAGWLDEGCKLAEIQTRIQQEFNRSLTYMEVKMLVSELDLLPRDPETPIEPDKPMAPDPAGPAAGTPAPGPSPSEPANARPGGVSVSVDEVAPPGVMISGKVTFGDGQTGAWFIDQSGQLGLAPTQKGYRPSQADMQSFQMGLDRELRTLGM